MIEYIYRGFKISYNIEQDKEEKSLYKATGCATCLLSVPKSITPANFHTEFNTPVGAEHEIRVLVENYINFELKSFYDKHKGTALM